MEHRAIRISPRDNVAIAVNTIPAGSIVKIPGYDEVRTNQEIPLGHKIAILPIAKGDAVVRYGEVICNSAQNIKRGDWVHTHNTVTEI